MTNEEARKILNSSLVWQKMVDEECEALELAIKALELEPRYDCVSRQAVEDAIANTTINGEGLGYGLAWDILYDLPPVTPQQKTGHWIIKEGKRQGYDIAGVKTWYIQIICDKCGFIKTAIEGHTGQYHYCPNCGVKMAINKEDNDEESEEARK